MKMIDILNKYKETDTFSLTGSIYKISITEEECQKALEKMNEKTEDYLRQLHDNNPSFVSNVPNFKEYRENYIRRLKFNKGKDPVKVLPKILQNNLIKYEVSFFNSVTESGMLMINYYFKLNDETKKYLLNYEKDFDLDELQDLTLYHKNKIKFYSCTHEKYNSLED